MKSIYLLLFASFFLFSSCEQEESFFGPEVLLAPEGFEITKGLSASSLSVDFASDSLNIFATLSQRATWQLSIQGLSSTASKTFKGIDSTLNVSWDGGSDNVYLFRRNETLRAILTVLGTSQTDTLELTVSNPKDLVGDNGVLIADFEGRGVTPSGWWNAFKTGELIKTSDRFSDILTPQGLNCLHLRGIDIAPDGFIGQTGHPGIFDYSSAGFPSDNSKLFFNFYLQGTTGTRIEVRLLQTVNGSTTGGNYSYFRNIDWTGWRLISVPYSDFNKTNNESTSPVQLGSAITRVQFVLRTTSDGSIAEADIDFPIFTINEPLKP